MPSQASRKMLGNDYPKADVTQANPAESKDCRILLNGVTAVSHIGPSFHPHEKEIVTASLMLQMQSRLAKTSSPAVCPIPISLNCRTMTASGMYFSKSELWSHDGTMRRSGDRAIETYS